jgi:hypothetical protein
MTREQPDDVMPEGLAARPRDERGLPIPPVNVHRDGSIDFTNINTGAGSGSRGPVAAHCAPYRWEGSSDSSVWLKRPRSAPIPTRLHALVA